ncbi:MAG: glycosyl hydrolase family 28-related protein [Paracoccaceae bacterium]|nr:glycosyl hydrolase family 28-related protein [Paracoccaceae bacterium]
MNKVITDGLLLMPPKFSQGLAVWSSGNGTPGDPTYDTVVGAAVAQTDPDFGPCLELLKNQPVQKIRYTGRTPVLPGMYLRVSARVKAVNGNLPAARIACWAGDSAGNHVAGAIEVGPSTMLTGYGDAVEITAIVGIGNRRGVDMVLGAGATFGHFGLDLTGATGGTIRVENIRITDVTDIFYRKLMDWVDVRDYGAVGDGVTDDSAAFLAADADAQGRQVLVSRGTYLLTGNVTMNAHVRFEGTVTMPDAARLQLTENFDLPSYVAAFGNEELGLKKALQALFNFTDHESLDMCGLRVKLSAPIDVHAVVGNQDTFANRRVLRNGQLESDGGPAWATDVVTAQASYDPTNPLVLSNVTGISQIPVGALVEGTGVGREVYVRARNVAAGTLTLSLPLHAAPAQQNYTFRRFKYLLDFSGFTFLQRFNIADVEFLCQGKCSGLMLADDGQAFHVRDCFFTAPLDRAITSKGLGCKGLQLDRNEFLSNEQKLNVIDRRTIAFNINGNDAKIRNNRAVRFRHFAVIHGTGHIISHNHFFQGDNAKTPNRTAGIVLSQTNPMAIIQGNYIDNCWIEWGNEHDATPDNSGGFSFGGLSIDGNIFFSGQSPAWFRFIRIKPYGQGHYINGLSVVGNTFKHTGGRIDRVDEVDTSIAPLDPTRYRNLRVSGNSFNGITARIRNPVTVEMSQSGASAAWGLDLVQELPFSAQARHVTNVATHNPVTNAAGNGIYGLPYSVSRLGINGTEIKLHWSEPVSGAAYVTVRADNLA